MEDFRAALESSEMLKYHFRNAAQTGLMVYRNYFSERKPLRKLQWSTEVIFNVLQKYEPDHVLLRTARQDTAAGGFLDAEGALEYAECLEKRRLAAPSAPGGARAAAFLRHVRHQDQGSAARGRPRRYHGAPLPSLVE